MHLVIHSFVGLGRETRINHIAKQKRFSGDFEIGDACHN